MGLALLDILTFVKSTVQIPKQVDNLFMNVRCFSELIIKGDPSGAMSPLYRSQYLSNHSCARPLTEFPAHIRNRPSCSFNSEGENSLAYSQSGRSKIRLRRSNDWIQRLYDDTMEVRTSISIVVMGALLLKLAETASLSKVGSSPARRDELQMGGDTYHSVAGLCKAALNLVKAWKNIANERFGRQIGNNPSLTGPRCQQKRVQCGI